ncbi:hypothetical protein BDZ94DRAFT_1296901 [Collybia nuda]|uniref:non-specific serine/threonine protein kinase n=1 Tax=Collybia nuda TaxID=64659 RepID=A0A9P5YBM2_9AGAR|nr:hypothetical protein BDZ94DRAFT_1296901 [Collybia nuda]
MLGSRTKQVYAYGKRNQRIVNISEDRQNAASGIFDDLEPPPQRAPIASKMKKRENIMPTKSKSASPKTIRISKKKRVSPVLSPAKKGTRIAQLIQAEVPEHELPGGRVKPATKVKKDGEIKEEITPPRAPLAFFPLNVPGSPAVSGRPRGSRVTSAKGGPLKLIQPFSPFVDMEIIVMDDKGNTLRKERRVSRTDIESNPINQVVPEQSKQPKSRMQSITTIDSDSDTEAVGPPKSKARPLRRALTIYSEDSDSESQEYLESPPSPRQFKSPTKPRPKSHLMTSTASLRSFVEVVIPPPPYPIRPTINPPSITTYSPLQPPPLEFPRTLPSHYQRMSSPVAKPRQLTPIRGGRGRQPFAPPSPPSPFTGTDFDISFEFEGLTLGSSSLDNTAHLELEIPQYLLPLLGECNQEKQGPIDFSSFIETFPYDPVVQSGDTPLHDSTFRKIGEASYSEVFGIGNVVLKVIPLRDDSMDDSVNPNSRPKMNMRYNENGEEEDGPAPSDAKDVRKEIIVTRAMGDVCDGFVKLLRTYVVRGKYPEVLLQLWDKYNNERGSESVRPDTFLVSQVYAIIVLPNGGPDLEAYKFINPSKMGWRQASSIFWQVAKALAHAEQLVSFEHRDLHWGQILVKNLHVPAAVPLKTLNQNQNSKPRSSRLHMDSRMHGVQATLIDLGLSRMDAGDGDGGEQVHWTPFEDEVFMGEGDYQFDVYRIMKGHNKGVWEDFNPLTNVMWLHYLLLKLLHAKHLKPPVTPRKERATKILSSETPAFTEKDCYNCLLDIEAWLGQCISGLVKPIVKGKARRKAQVVSPIKAVTPNGPACAGEVVAYAVKKGWITATS